MENIKEIDIFVGKKLRELREARGLSCLNVGELLSRIDGGKQYTFQQMRRYEKGETKFTLKLLLQLCEIFKVDLNYFLYEKNKVVFRSDGKDDMIIVLNKRTRSKLFGLFEAIQELSEDKFFDTILTLIKDVDNIKEKAKNSIQNNS